MLTKFLLLLTVSTTVTVAVASDVPTVTLTDGTTLHGSESRHVATFKGLRYAMPPTGPLRWAPPVSYTPENPSETVVDATEFGSICTQPKFGGGTEDCLFLNVYVKSEILENVTTSLLPVGIFIHGGSYHDGSSNLYDATQLVDYLDGNAIIVTINYRLNVFGFLGSEELRSQDPANGSTGNYGFQDQRMAMQWVQDNIKSFGGDPNRVMIYGESAGAGSVTNHLTMKKSMDNNLYSSAIIESGAFALWNIQNFTLSQGTYDRLLVEVGCSDLDCMLAKSTSEIFEPSQNVKSLDVNYLYPYNPTNDGVEIMTHPWIALTNGDVKDVPIILGTNEDEGSIFTKLPKDATQEQLIAHWTREDYSIAEQETMLQMYVDEATYPDVKGDSVYWWAGQRSLGDISMSCPSKYSCQQLSSLPGRVSSAYLYHFEHKKAGSDYVQHTAELSYVFHNFIQLQDSNDRSIADLMSSYWGNFLLSEEHNPNSNLVGLKAVPHWPAYDVVADDSLIVKDTVEDTEVVSGLKKEECVLANHKIDVYVRSYFPE
jgi:carboxylesterase type B